MLQTVPILLTAFQCRNASAFITGTLDTKGRITIPADVRSRFGLDPGDDVQAVLNPVRIDRVPVDSPADAQQMLQDYEDVRWFRYADGVLEVVRDAA
jgi:AbrB family looped-hinge helix DNA binding protein